MATLAQLVSDMRENKKMLKQILDATAGLDDDELLQQLEDQYNNHVDGQTHQVHNTD